MLMGVSKSTYKEGLKMISKNLLSEVLDINIKYISDKYDNNLVSYELSKKGWQTINIYELVNYCKQWAFKQKFVIYSSCKSASIYKDLEYLYGASNEPTEPEAVFNACEWILKERKYDKQYKV